MAHADLVVVGSANVDRTIRVERFPSPGQTVTGGEVQTRPGGKGLNQAVAASRLGAAVAFVGALGNDNDGATIRACLEDESIRNLMMATDSSTGMAAIAVDAGGENTIVLSPGANHELSTDHLHAHQSTISAAPVVLAQLEVPLALVQAALSMASGLRVLTPAPARPLPPDVLQMVDVLIPNQGELATLTGLDVNADHDAMADAARSLAVDRVLVTLGSDGVLLVTSSNMVHIQAPDVETVDTTGAGDTFCGALGAIVAGGRSLEEALPRAVAAASLSVTMAGAQAAMPTADTLDAFVKGE